jgi:hypothetical protein
MTVLQRQQQLIQQISTTKDEDVLAMIEEEISFHLQTNADITDQLTPYELKELKELADDTDDDNIVSFDEYRKATEKWRMN